MNGALGVEGIRSRVAELASLVDPNAAAAKASSSSADFAALLAAAQQQGAGDSDLLQSLGLSGTGLSGTGLSGTGLAGTSGTGSAGLAALLRRLAEGRTSSTTSGGTDISGGTATAQDLIATASAYTGVPYVWGGESLSEGGLDCSGLVLRSLTDLGVTKVTDVPRTARAQQQLGTKVDSLDQALPGDLLVFNGGTHIAIYLGDGKMIDAPKPGGTVGVHRVYAEPTNIRRVLPQAGAAGSGVAAVSSVTTATAQRAALALLAGQRS